LRFQRDDRSAQTQLRSEPERVEAGIAGDAEGDVTVRLPLGRAEIEQIIPHREPLLLIDEVVDLTPGLAAAARKRVRDDEWYLAGHFPGRPVMPGVLIVEALAQTGAVAVLSEAENRGRLALFAGIDGCRFKRIVEPGDTLDLRCELERVRGPVGRGAAEARVEGKLACRATLTFAVETQ
jgi:3-hydroxyacyl-[acyl-carrier-protein] dehydratase